MPYLEADTSGMRELMERFGAELRRCRYQVGLSQSSLAQRSGVPQSTISRLERGRTARVPVVKLVMLSEAMGRFFPFAFCPHDHGCAWQRLDSSGRPIELPGPIENEWWYRGR
ncbi:MAG: helix-turn-helix domain-containing protein [Chloroflexota bacterium]